MVSDHAAKVLQGLSPQIGEGWFRHQRAAGTADDLLHFITADGAFDAKLDGLVHAAAMTTPFIIRHAREDQPELDLPRVTAWSATTAAARYAQWQVDFHWKIDTRLWQYLLLAKLMRRSYIDAIRAADLDETDESELLAANESFWDEVDVAYTYRMEVIERARGFAPHPDTSAGANDHAYSYHRLVAGLDQDFGELHFELTNPSLGAGTGPRTHPRTLASTLRARTAPCDRRRSTVAGSGTEARYS